MIISQVLFGFPHGNLCCLDYKILKLLIYFFLENLRAFNCYITSQNGNGNIQFIMIYSIRY